MKAIFNDNLHNRALTLPITNGEITKECFSVDTDDWICTSKLHSKFFMILNICSHLQICLLQLLSRLCPYHYTHTQYLKPTRPNLQSFPSHWYFGLYLESQALPVGNESPWEASPRVQILMHQSKHHIMSTVRKIIERTTAHIDDFSVTVKM